MWNGSAKQKRKVCLCFEVTGENCKITMEKIQTYGM